MLEPSGLYYPNRIARAFFLAMQDIMGQNGLNATLGLAGLPSGEMPPDNLARQFDFATMSALNQALEEMYGPRGGRGIALKIGRASFSRGIKRFGALAGIGDPAFQVLPLNDRIDLGLRALASIFTNFSDQKTDLLDEDDTYSLHVEVSPMAWGRLDDRPVCHALVGVVQECLRWASNGYEFHVRETSCTAMGSDECVFKITKRPIGQL